MQKEIGFLDVARFVWGYFVRRPLILLGVIILTVAISATEVAMPYFVGEFTDLLAQNTPKTPELAAGIVHYLLLITAAGVAFWVLRIATHYTYDYFLKFPAMRDAATDGFRRVTAYSTDWHVNTFAGSTVRRIGRGMWAVERFADRFYGNFFPLCCVMIGTLIMLALRWQLMGGILAIGVVVYLGISILLSQRFVAGPSRAAAMADTRLGAAIADAVTCNATIKAFGRERDEYSRFSRVAEEWRRLGFRNYFTHNTVNLAQSFLMTGLKMGLFAFIAWLWWVDRATVGEVVFVIGMYNLVSSHLRTIGDQIREVQNATKDLEDLVGFAHTEPDIRDAPAARKLVVTRGEIRFAKVGFRYPSQTAEAYRNFSLTIYPGEKVALVGHSGSGKSTFVKLLMRLYDVQQGAITIDGQNIAAVTQESLHQSIALVPQEPLLFHRSLADNIGYGRPLARQREIEAAAKKAHAHEFIRTLPLKYQTFVGERGVKLSGGERQRVAIARAILADSPILVLDEATSSLDSISESYIQDALTKLMAGRTTIIVAHRLSTIKQVDRILVFDRGRIVEEGSHAALLRRKNGVYRQFYEMQADGFIAEDSEPANHVVNSTASDAGEGTHVTIAEDSEQ